jgi:hypothetical protein
MTCTTGPFALAGEGDGTILFGGPQGGLRWVAAAAGPVTTLAVDTDVSNMYIWNASTKVARHE